MSYIISGIQQLGIGNTDVEKNWAWYRRAFGMDVPVFREAAEAPLMTRYTGGEVHARDAVLAINIRGGGGFEIWQFTSRVSQPPEDQPALGDYGIFAGLVKSRNVREAHAHLAGLGAFVTDPVPGPDGKDRCFTRDPEGNYFQIVEAADWFGKPGVTGGVGGALIGTSDVEKALPLYSDVLGYDTVVYDETDVFADYAGIPGGDEEVRRVMLTHAAPRKGPFSELVGASSIELVQRKAGGAGTIFADRFWGDRGFIHLCFDIRGMDSLRTKCEQAGFPFTVDSGDTFDMGDAGGRFSYCEDPDGTLIEFVETHKVPIAKAIGLSLNLIKRPADKALPRWMVKALGLARRRD